MTCSDSLDSITGFLQYFSCFLGNFVLPVLVGLALLFFIYGMILFIAYAGNPQKKEEARNRAIWGLVGLFVITAVWGLVGILNATVFDESGSFPFLRESRVYNSETT